MSATSDNLNTRLSTQDFIQVNRRVFSPKPQSFWLFSIEKYCIYSVCYYVLLNFMSVFHPDYQPQINSNDALNENLKTDLVFPWKTHLLGDFLQEDQQNWVRMMLFKQKIFHISNFWNENLHDVHIIELGDETLEGRASFLCQISYGLK